MWSGRDLSQSSLFNLLTEQVTAPSLSVLRPPSLSSSGLAFRSGAHPSFPPPQSVAAENYPFCTIEPTDARCPVPVRAQSPLARLSFC